MALQVYGASDDEYRETEVVAVDQNGYEFRIDPNDFQARKLSRGPEDLERRR